MIASRTLKLTLLTTAAVFALQGCTIPVEVRTTPPGATVIANGDVIGTTPMEFDPEELFPARFKGYQWEREGTLELARSGCEPVTLPVDNELVKRSIRVKLECDPNAMARPAGLAAPAAAAAPAPAHQAPASAGEKLREIEDLRRQGLISEQEYQDLRRRVLERF